MIKKSKCSSPWFPVRNQSSSAKLNLFICIQERENNGCLSNFIYHKMFVCYTRAELWGRKWGTSAPLQAILMHASLSIAKAWRTIKYLKFAFFDPLICNSLHPAVLICHPSKVLCPLPPPTWYIPAPPLLLYICEYWIFLCCIANFCFLSMNTILNRIQTPEFDFCECFSDMK